MFSIVQKEYNTDIIQLDKYILSSRHKIDMVNIFWVFLNFFEILKYQKVLHMQYFLTDWD